MHPPNRFTCVAFAVLVATVACGSESAGPDVEDAAVGTGPDADPGTFRSCRGRAFVPVPVQDWEHTATSVIVAAGDPNHSAQDVLAKPGTTPLLVGKFTYGTVSKDLEDEHVRVFLDQCDDWHDLGDHVTNSDGRISLSAPDSLGPGVYEARLQVLGDQSTTTSFLWVLPAGTRLMITDIDGTLTASDSELFMQILDGSHVPVSYPGAVDLTRAHDERGWIPVYLTGRPYWLTTITRDWVADLDCAAGPLHVTDSNGEALPTEAGVGAYKKAYLESLIAAGYVVDFAYGNAPTDIFAYLGAGIPADQAWIIGANAGQMGTHAVVDSWQARADEVRALPPVVQPFK